MDGRKVSSGIDLRLPSLSIPSRSHSQGKTNVSLEDSVFGRVEFVPWDSFHTMLNKTSNAIQSLSHEELIFPNMMLTLLRMELSEVKLLGELPGISKSELGEGSVTKEPDLPGGSSAERNTERSNSYVARFPSVTVNMDALLKTSSNKTFTTETSTYPVMHSVYRVSEVLLCTLRKNSNLCFRNYSVQSEALRRRHYRSLRPLPNVSVVPDRSLLLNATDVVHKNSPVCTFEFKGPKFPLAGSGTLPAGNGDGVERRDIFCFGMEDASNDAAGRSNRRETATFAEEGHSAAQEDLGINDLQDLASAGDVADWLQEKFPIGKKPNDFKYGSDRKFQRVIAQVIVQALSSKSGCTYLSTYQVGIGFQLLGLNEEKSSMRVSVTRPYRCIDQKGIVASIITLCDYAMDLCSDSRAQRIRDCATLTHLGKIPESDGSGSGSDGGPDGRSWGGKRPRSEGSGGISESTQRKRRTNSGTSRPQSKKQSDGKQNKRLSSAYEHCSRHKELDSIENRDSLSFRSDETVAGGSHGYRGTEQSMQSRLWDMLTTATEVTGIGYVGVVELGKWNEQLVAIKSWNAEAHDGIKSLRHEIEIYSWIETHYPELFGVALPTLRVAWTPNGRVSGILSRDLLVIDFVGNGIEFGSDGYAYLLGKDSRKRLNEIEVKNISEAAMDSLKLLHRSGITHGDIALRNLRVFKDDECGKENQWKTFWIDLGDAELVDIAIPGAFQCEVRACIAIFRKQHLKHGSLPNKGTRSRV